MATGSSQSSSTGSRGGKQAQPLCPFCKTATVVERVSRTTDHPDMPFYTCRNRDWGNNKCKFFMWKPASEGSGGDAAPAMPGLEDLENSVTNVNNLVSALRTDVNAVVRQQIANKWLNVASVILGVVSFVAICMLLYGQSNMTFAL